LPGQNQLYTAAAWRAKPIAAGLLNSAIPCRCLEWSRLTAWALADRDHPDYLSTENRLAHETRFLMPSNLAWESFPNRIPLQFFDKTH
jgi:hypothetical protein